MAFGSSPDRPDYRGAAEEQGEANREAIAAQTFANRPDQFTPFGSSTWQPVRVRDPSTGEYVTKWTQTIGLTPEQQQALQSQLAIQQGRSDIAAGLMDRVGQEFGQPVNWEPLSANTLGVEPLRQAYNRMEGVMYGRAKSRLDPQWDEDQTQLEGQLYNQGLRPGDEAYDAAMGNFNRARTDAYNQAMFGAQAGGFEAAERAFGAGLARRQQALAERLQRRGWSINEINAVLGGQQVGMPGMPGFERSGAAAPTPYFAAEQGGYGADLDRFNARQMGLQGMMSGITGVASAAAPFAFMMSDRRLKSGVTHIGQTSDGHNVYLYNRDNKVEVGVIADELPEGATVTGEFTGKSLVDYSQIRGFSEE